MSEKYSFSTTEEREIVRDIQGDDAPRAVFPAIVGRSSQHGVIVEWDKKKHMLEMKQ